MTQKRASNGEALLLAAGNFYSTFADERVEAAIGAGEQAMRGGLLQYGHAFSIGCVRIDEEQVFADGSGKQLRVLGHEPDFFAENIQIHAMGGNSVVENLARFRSVQADQQFHQS